MSFTERVSYLRPEGAYAVLTKAQRMEREGRDIIHLEIGQPEEVVIGPGAKPFHGLPAGTPSFVHPRTL